MDKEIEDFKNKLDDLILSKDIDKLLEAVRYTREGVQVRMVTYKYEQMAD